MIKIRPTSRLFRDHPPRRIAILRALQLGDLLVAVPAFRSLRAGFPEAEITLIGLPWARSFTRRFHRYLDRFVEFPGYPGIAEAEYNPERTAGFLAAQRAYGYDLAIQLHGSGQNSNPFILELGARVTAGMFEGGQHVGPGEPFKAFAAGVPATEDRPTPMVRRSGLRPWQRGEPATEHRPTSRVLKASLSLGLEYPHDKPEVLRNLDLMRLLDCPDRGTQLEYPLFEEDRAEAARLLRAMPATSGPRIGLHAGARSPARRWPPEYFAALGDELAHRYGAQIILTGGPGDEVIVESVLHQMKVPAQTVAGKTSRGGLAALIARLDLFISNDSGPAHVAEAIGTPSITIFGPVDPGRWAPLDQEHHRIVRRPVACSPCGFWECPIDHRCLRWLTPETVLEVAQDLLAEGAIACHA